MKIYLFVNSTLQLNFWALDRRFLSSHLVISNIHMKTSPFSVSWQKNFWPLQTDGKEKIFRCLPSDMKISINLLFTVTSKVQWLGNESFELFNVQNFSRNKIMVRWTSSINKSMKIHHFQVAKIVVALHAKVEASWVAARTSKLCFRFSSTLKSSKQLQQELCVPFPFYF